MLAVAGALAFAQARDESAPPALHDFEARVWTGPSFGRGPAANAVVLVPRARRADERFPLLIAMHGLGETWRGPARGAWGWVRDYELPRADHALRGPSLDPSHFEQLVDAARLRELNASLSARRYGGMVIILPFTMDPRAGLGGSEHQRFERWISHDLVARARRELPVIASREATGIDGVSLGGLHALWTGLAHPEVFGSVGALQPAVRRRQAQVAARFVHSRTRPTQRIRLVTSTLDALREDVIAFDRTLSSARIAHEFKMLVGPHDYIFNRGPGAIEMLLFHDRALRGLAAP